MVVVPGHPSDPHQPSQSGEGIDPEVLAFAQRMFDLARQGDHAALTRYLAAGLPVDMTDAKGDTLLILAAYHQHVETVSALLAAGADVSRSNDRGQTALVAAVFRQDADIVASLLAAGADPGDGSPSAVATAEFYELTDMQRALGAAPTAD